MSICDSGVGSKVCGRNVLITVPKKHPFIMLCNQLPWEKMLSIILDDLKNSTPSKRWFCGRKLKVRIHLGAYILQQMNNLTDRKTEAAIKENAVYQIFCGQSIVENWHCPDHTKIESFRSRLKPETQEQLANLICQHAVKLGIAVPNDLDVDSTIQEANMTYPTDAKMLRKLSGIASTVSKGIKGLITKSKQKTMDLTVDIKTIASKAKAYFFMPKKTNNTEKSTVLSELWSAVSEPVLRIISACKDISQKAQEKLSWNIKRAIDQLLAHGKSYLASAKIFIETGKAENNKRLSFHVDAVSCFNKKKDHKKYEFGRCIQLGRISGNFMFVKKSENVRMDDKKSFIPIIDEHAKLFGKNKLNSVATDKGYYSKKNVKYLIKKNVKEIGIQVPGNTNDKNITLSDDKSEALRNRRAGIEPLIGHIKQGGQLGRSRMKNDDSVESSAYASVFGFNLRQTMNALIFKEK